MEIIEQFLTFRTFIIILIGVITGIVVGALPGLSSTMAVALLIPVTFPMGSVEAIIMLVAVYTAAIYGGSLSAILIHTPGTPASAASSLDGYQMTRNGEGLRAIGISTISSMIGGVASGIALLVIAPPLSTISLIFGPSEYFLVTVFALTIIGSLATDSMVKGLMSGVFGLIIGTIGMDALTGTPRFTFGILSLESGVAMVPAMIGLFSLSQVLILSENKDQKEQMAIKGLTGRLLPSLKELKDLSGNFIRSSGIGTFVGILPGAGGSIASWISYNEAKRFSKKPETFGKGNVHGLASSEVANNSVTGGALIPLLTLGIPGSATTAVLLGGLFFHGLVPGRELFTTQADITYSIIIGLILANIMMGIIGLLGARYFVKVSALSTNVLSPSIVVLCIVGSFAINNNLFDVWIMFIFGIIGYFMRKTGFHPAPLVLAIILGPLAEDKFRQSLNLADGNLLTYYFSRPVSIILIAITILSLFSPLIIKWWNKRNV